MKTTTRRSPSYHGYRFPAEIIAHCTWLYFRFCLSFRDVQELMLERDVEVSHETIRLWTLKFGAEYARRLRQRGGRCGDTWYIDEVFCKINGRQVYLWRAVDQDGEVLDILVQQRRNAKAAKRFFRKLLKGLKYVPRAIVTDSYPDSGPAGVCSWGISTARANDRSWAARSHSPRLWQAGNVNAV